MPPKKAAKRCDHATISYSTSTYADEVGFKRQTLQQRLAAATPRGTLKSTSNSTLEFPGAFPAPLVLPDDDLALDPKHPTQSLRSWIQEKHRNKVTPKRQTIYLAMPPSYSESTAHTKKWAQPRHGRKKTTPEIEQPKAQDVLEYLEAFYHGLPVKLVPPSQLSFTTEIGDQDDIPPTPKDRELIGLNFKPGFASKGIRTRPRPKGDYSHQLNLDDLLTAAIWALPSDAYALIMLIEHDMYEDEEDEFVCGRAYGGSRVAVITTARYNPLLDKKQGVEREHAWPASHCQTYIESMTDSSPPLQPKKPKSPSEDEPETPLKAAITAHNTTLASLLSPSPTPASLSDLWLTRVCRTASHELGHCFGLGHCVYYACSMQGSASIQEDARQPPYLCPVCLEKVLYATGGNVRERYRAVKGFCESGGRGEVGMFAAFGRWVEGRLAELERVEGSEGNLVEVSSD